VSQNEEHREGAGRVEGRARVRRPRTEAGSEAGPVEEEEREGEPPRGAVEDDERERPDVPGSAADGEDPGGGAEELGGEPDSDPRSRAIDVEGGMRVREGVGEDRDPGHARGDGGGRPGIEEIEERTGREEEPRAEDEALGGGEGEDEAVGAGSERVDR
jgi:hypothetical protein